MPDMVMDEHLHGIQSEDVDTDQEDHTYDEVRYACTSRPWQRNIEKKKEPIDRWFKIEEKAEDSWRTL
jgi:hypothetical protein